MPGNVLLVDNYKKGSELGEARADAFAAHAPGIEVIHHAQLKDFSLAGYSHVMLSGSQHNITNAAEDRKMIARLRALVEDAAKREVALLGVCYGHQLLAHHFGGTVVKGFAEEGMLAKKLKPGFPLAEGLPEEILVEESHKHSVKREGALLGKFEDYTPEGEKIVQAMKHKQLPFFGVQFHPETRVEWAESENEKERAAFAHGKKILENFLKT